MIPAPMRQLYPFDGSFFRIGNHHLHYIDEGKGPPILMLHGNPTWSFYYRRAIRDLSSTHRVIVPDHIGCGLSDKPDDSEYEYTLARRVDDLERLLASLNLAEPLTLMVHDWGGVIGLAYAVRHPDKIVRIVLTNTAGFPLTPGRRLPVALHVARAPVLGPLLVRGLNLFCRGATKHGVTRARMPASVRAGYLWPYRSWSDRRAIHRFIQDIPVRGADKSFSILQEVATGLDSLRSKPRLILWGGRDFVFDRFILERWRLQWPDAVVKEFGDAGHYLFEDSWPECRDAIDEFLGYSRDKEE